MPKTIKLEPHLDSEELENRYRKARDAVERSHCQIFWLISEGKIISEVTEVTGYSRGWIQQLARRYNADGSAKALGDARRRNPGAAHHRATGGARPDAKGASPRQGDVELKDGVRDPQNAFAPKPCCPCTDLTAEPERIVSWFVLRWKLEVAFQEVRRHLGVETQRQWSELAIRRTMPALLGLFSPTRPSRMRWRCWCARSCGRGRRLFTGRSGRRRWQKSRGRS